ncbi:MAG: hypothetical protein IAI50_07120, partial [Candidatus Eremiobacteraeota bacterium]|nr:hypothetical protein [Candidatus Eremiobacteraeota bacterium]
ALDAAGNLYVSCENTSSGSTGVMEFAPTLQRSVAWYPSPTSQSYGITVDERDNLFVDLGFYGTAIEFSRATPNVYAVAAINGAPSAGGIVFSEGNLIMSGGTGLWIFSPSPPASKFAFTLAGYIDYGVGHATGYLARGRDGTLYVPVYGSSGGHSPVHEVRVYRQSADKPFQDRIYSTLSAGLQEPSGVALGPR